MEAWKNSSAIDADLIGQTVELWLTAQRNPRTKRAYSRTYRRWVDFLGATPLDRATMLHVQAYYARRAEEPGMRPRGGGSDRVSGNTLNTEHAALSSLYGALLDNGLIKRNPFKVVGAPCRRHHRAKRPTEMVPFDQVGRLLDAPSKYTLRGRTDRAWLALLFFGGLRRSEIVRLTRADVITYPDGYAVRLRETKNGDDIEHHLPGAATGAIASYLADAPGEGPLFNIGEKGIYSRLRRYCIELGLPTSYTPHAARATAITRLLALGLDHREVQEFSRHSSVDMVEQYDKRRYARENAPGRKLEY